MAVGSGVTARFAYAKEAVRNTRTIPNHWVPFTQETIQDTGSQPIQVGAMMGARRLGGLHHRGKRNIAGSISVPLVAESMGGLLEAAMGKVVTAGSSPTFTHTITRDLLPSFSAQFAWDPQSGSALRKDLVGGMINTWSLTVAPDEVVKFGAEVVGWSLAGDGQAVLTPTWPTFTPLTYAHTSLTVAGSPVCIDSLTIAGNNNLYQSPAICAADKYATEWLDVNPSTYSGEFVTNFEAWATHWDKFQAGTESAVVLTIEASPTRKLVLTGNVVMTGDTPVVDGPSVVKHPIKFEFVHATSDVSALSMVLTNGDATA